MPPSTDWPDRLSDRNGHGIVGVLISGDAVIHKQEIIPPRSIKWDNETVGYQLSPIPLDPQIIGMEMLVTPLDTVWVGGDATDSSVKFETENPQYSLKEVPCSFFSYQFSPKIPFLLRTWICGSPSPPPLQITTISGIR